ncbi:MAG: sialate O-acetylesterase [bacterium]
MNVRVLMSAMILLAVGSYAGELKLAPFYSSNMVLQRDKPIVITGTAGAGEAITAEFRGAKAQSVADAKGVFKVTLPAQKTCRENSVLTVKSAQSTVELKDLLVGDVWLCAGQSNMEMNLHSSNPGEDMQKANYPLMRRIKFQRVTSPFPMNPMQVATEGVWQVATPQSVGGWTAVGFYFARMIQRENPDMPIGLYDCNWGGSPIECWIPMESWANFPALKNNANEVANRDKIVTERLEKYLQNVKAWSDLAQVNIKDKVGFPNPPNADLGYGNSSTMYNGMMECLTVTPIAGALWYQGESNAGQLDYDIKMDALFSGWRKAWGIDFPCYVVQLASFMRPNDDPAGRDGWAVCRETQSLALRAIPKTGMAVATDIGEESDIHPKNKFDVGERLARWALRDIYGDTKVAVSGPLYKAMKVEGDKIRISFDYAESGLMVGKKSGRALTEDVVGGKLGGFVIGNKEGKWAWAEAIIDGTAVVVSSPDIKEPVAVRYAYSNNPVKANLYNKAGLPASPFTTEKIK